MADISKIKALNGTTYNIKDTVARTGTIETSRLVRPPKLNGVIDNTIVPQIDDLRANRLAFLPADQIIIEKTTDGGSTWVDAGISDSVKQALFAQTRPGVYIPLLNGEKNILCGLRITFTAMKYDVPSGTAETQKYNYWNSSYIKSTERYNQLREMYFWVSSNSDAIKVKLERATGAKPNNWIVLFDRNDYGMNGWSGNDYISFSQGVFGGGTNQTGNYWNYRLTFFTCGANGSSTLSGTSKTSAQSISEIRGYGTTWWTAGNKFAASDHMYSWDSVQNVTFPKKVTATDGFSGSGASLTNLNADHFSSGTLPISRGGTGQTSEINAANSLINSLTTGNDVPKDNDFFISQYVNGGSTTKTYHRRPISKIWEYVKEKISSVLGLSETGYTGSAAKVNNHTVNSDVPANAKFTDTTYSDATTSASGLMSASDKTKLNGIAEGATANVGTITGITMNGASKGTSGVVNLGTVLTAHQDISGKVNGPSTSNNGTVALFNGTTGKTIKDSGFTIGKSVPADAVFTDTTYSDATTSASGLMSASDKTKLNGIAEGATANAGTITGITMNGSSKGTSGVVNLGTVLTAHQSITHLAPKASPVFTGSISLGRKSNSTVGTDSFAVGSNVIASEQYSHAEGNYSTASGVNSHAEGNGSTASNHSSHAEGYRSSASGAYSHAEGDSCTASGEASHAEGSYTTASGMRSHAEGYETIASHAYQHVFGTDNIRDTSTAANTEKGNYIEIVGNGTSTTMSNARTLDWSGNERLKGTLYVNADADGSGGEQIATKSELTSINQALSKLDSAKNITNDILADAVNITTTTLYYGGGSGYTGVVPNSNYKFGTFTVNVRGVAKYVVAVDSIGNMATNVYMNNAWSGWQEHALKSELDATNQAISSKVNPIYNAPTETFNGDLDTLTTPGWYVLGTSATNAPPITASGRLLVAQMGTSPYIRQTYYCGYDNKIFTRVRSYYSNAWHWFEWQQLVTNELSTATIAINTSNARSFSFSGLHNISNSSIFKHGQLIWGVGSSDANMGMSLIFVNTDGTVTIKNVTGTGRTFTGSVSNGVLTITANADMYGGLKLIWLT